jgi:CDP-diacylglycerol--glycerol-3-phosphate 3-phosphatidyltransferase
MTDRAELRRRWSALHHDIDAASMPLLSGWLKLMWRTARPLARAGVPPTVLTVTGMVAASGAVGCARRRPSLGALLVVAAAVCDGLDGAVAVVGDRATRTGARADALADRYCDAAFAAVLWRRGVPGWVSAGAAGLAVAVDGLRRLRHIPDRITVAERPTFTICAALACASTARRKTPWPAAICAAVWIGTAMVGVGQLLRTPTRGVRTDGT